MARLPRLTVPGYPHHVIQRGNNRQAIFATNDDRRFMLDTLASRARDLQVAVHAYVLMDNHFHLLATPATAEGLPALMQGVGRSYVRRYNDTHGRTGTLWDGRYRSTVVQADRYLLACMAYIDLNPVRAGLVQAPADYAWSSHRHYVGVAGDRLVTPHALYWALGNTPFAREQAYGELVAAGVPDDLGRRLAEATNKGWGLGDQRHLEALEREGGRRASPRSPGRPRRAAKSVPDSGKISAESG